MANQAKSNSSKPVRTGRVKDSVSKVKVIRFSFTNILLLIGIIVAALILVNTYMQPSLGQEVDIDTFLNNLGQNRYSRVDIRNDGNAVAYGKYLDVASLENGQEIEAVKGVEVKQDLETKKVGDLVAVFKPKQNLNEVIDSLRAGLSREVVREIYVLDNKIIVDWENPDKRDWLIAETSETELIKAFSEDNLDIAEIPTKISYLRTAADVDRGDLASIKQRLDNKRYAQVWVVDEIVYARVANEKNVRNYVNFGTATGDFTKFLQEEGVNLSSQTVEFSVLPINRIDFTTIVNLLLIAGLIFTGYILIRSLNGTNSGLMRFGQSKARMFFGQKTGITFKDVAGVNEAKQELLEVVDFLRNPGKYRKLGAKIPRGVLMVGEPGTGKTLMARAVAGEAGVPFFHTSGSEFEEMLVGAGASRVRDLFDKAKKAAPALIFIDEIDAVGRKRGTTIQSSSTEQTLNQILVEMDGFETNDNVIVIAATNRPDVLDPALLRPGRFDRKVVLDMPDIEGRVEILNVHAQGKPLAANVDLEKVAKRTVGFSGADLENMLNEAAIIVAKEDRKEVTMADIEEAATKVQTGPIRKRKRTEKELKMTAYHEAAHAIVMKYTPESDPVHRITILSRGMALGYTMPLPQNDELQMTKTKMESKIRSLLAGFTAEEMIFGDVTTGASNDIERATTIAKKMVKQFGMSKSLGLIKYGNVEEEPHLGWSNGDRGYSDKTAEMIDEEIRGIVKAAYEDAKKILAEHRDKLDSLAEKLLEAEVVEADEFLAIFAEK